VKVCPKCERPVYDSWFLFKTHIETRNVCHNAKSKLCEKCQEPECDLTGWVKEN